MNLAALEGIEIASGGHQPGKSACLMECVALLAGEPWGDHPACSDDTLAAYGRSLNDRLLTTPERTAKYGPELLALAPSLVGSRGTAEDATRRADLLGDWYIREHLPRILRYAELPEQADKLASLSPITEASMQAALGAVKKVAMATWAAWATMDAMATWAARATMDAWAAMDAWATMDAMAARAARDAMEAWAARAAMEAWAARDAWAATFDLTAQARAKAAGVTLSVDAVGVLMAPVIEELEREEIAIFRRLIEAGPHGGDA